MTHPIKKTFQIQKQPPAKNFQYKNKNQFKHENFRPQIEHKHRQNQFCTETQKRCTPNNRFLKKHQKTLPKRNP